MPEDQQTSYYTERYRQVVQGSDAPTDKDLRIQSGRARHIVEFIRRYVPSVQSHLDIGSSSGALLSVVSATYGADSIGVEPGNAYRDFSNSHGLSAVPSLGHVERNGFDLVTLSHVLEHLPDPVAYLGDLRTRWLRPGGHIVVEVPNLYGHQSLELSHQVAFSASTLVATLWKAGFEGIHTKVHGQPRTRLMPLYILSIAAAPRKPRRPGRVRSRSWGVRFKRRVGNYWRMLLTQQIPDQAWLTLPELDERLDG
jgi:SAM-dependent methyltransferase